MTQAQDIRGNDTVQANEPDCDIGSSVRTETRRPVHSTTTRSQTLAQKTASSTQNTEYARERRGASDDPNECVVTFKRSGATILKTNTWSVLIDEASRAEDLKRSTTPAAAENMLRHAFLCGRLRMLSPDTRENLMSSASSHEVCRLQQPALCGGLLAAAASAVRWAVSCACERIVHPT